MTTDLHDRARAAGCPMASGFDPFARELLGNPFPAWADVRSLGKIAYSPRLDHYLVTDYTTVAALYKDQERLSAANASSPISPLAEEARAILQKGMPRKPTLNNSDPPRHAPMRRALANCMGAVMFRKLQPQVAAYAELLVDRMVHKPQADLVADLCFPLPMYAAFRLLGYPEGDSDMLKAWCEERVLITYGNLGAEGQVAAAKTLVRFWKYVEDFIAMRRREPADDLATALIAYSDRKPDELASEDITNIIYSVSLAAHETTTNAIGNGLHALLAHRGQWERLCADPSLIDNAIEECLRFESPVIGKRRVAKVDIEIDGVTIPAGANVLLMIGGAHHDAANFPEPDALDIGRSNAGDHVAFGGPWHYCLGAPFARFEFKAVLDQLTRRLPDMQLLPDQDFGYLPTPTHRGRARLMVSTGVG